MADSFIFNGAYFWMETCYTCKVPFAMDNSTYEAACRGKENFNFKCPYGHSQHYCTGESALDKVRRERDRLKQQMAEKDDEIQRQKEKREHAERSASAFKGKVTRLRNRAKAGLCPCCNRSFENLHRHMKSKHPEFQAEEAA